MLNLWRGFQILTLLTITACSTMNREKYTCHAEEVLKYEPICSNWNDLNEKQMDWYRGFLRHSASMVKLNLDAPNKDGNKYLGRISICLDRKGIVDEIIVRQRSGHEELDQAFLKSLKTLKPLPMPNESCLADLIYYQRLELFYDEQDMLDE